MVYAGKLLGFTLCFGSLAAATLCQTEHTRVGVAHDAVRNAAVASADCMRRIACDDPGRWGGIERGSISGQRAEAIRECGITFLKPLEGGEHAEIAIEPSHVREGDEACATVRLAFPCTVPFAGSVTCGADREVALKSEECVTVTGCDQTDSP